MTFVDWPFVRRQIVSVVLIVGASAVFARDAARQSFDVVVPFAPTAVETDGHKMLSYELHLTNFALYPLTIRAVRVYSRNVALAVIDDSLAERSVVLGGAAPENALTVAPGRARLYSLSSR